MQDWQQVEQALLKIGWRDKWLYQDIDLGWSICDYFLEYMIRNIQWI